MAPEGWKVRLAGGSALVARQGGVVLLADAHGGAQDGFVDVLLDVCRTAAVEHEGEPGKRLVRKVASLVSQADVDDVPSFGVLASLGDDVAAFLVGDVSLEIDDSVGKEVVSGRDVSTWVDRIVRAPFASLALLLGEAGEVDPRSDLASGTVSAGGVVLTSGATTGSAATAGAASATAPTRARGAGPGRESEPAQERDVTPDAEATTVSPMPDADLPAPDAPLVTAPREPAAQAGPVRSTTPFTAIALDEPLPQQAAPLPVAGEPVDDDQPQVQGITCSRGHFNDPTAVYCSACGISMVHQTHNLVWGKRPPLGVLVFDDGSVVPVKQDYVLGREPEGAPQVADGSAVPLQIDDPELKVSRVHARIQLKDWDVRVVDAGSANGTSILKRGQSEWVRLVPEEPVTITPGTRVTMGGRTLEFDSHHKT